MLNTPTSLFFLSFLIVGKTSHLLRTRQPRCSTAVCPAFRIHMPHEQRTEYMSRHLRGRHRIAAVVKWHAFPAMPHTPHIQLLIAEPHIRGQAASRALRVTRLLAASRAGSGERWKTCLHGRQQRDLRIAAPRDKDCTLALIFLRSCHSRVTTTLYCYGLYASTMILRLCSRNDCNSSARIAAAAAVGRAVQAVPRPSTYLITPVNVAPLGHEAVVAKD